MALAGLAIVHDIKGENWTLTAGFRSRHGRVLLFDPTNPKSAVYNPLLEVRRGAHVRLRSTRATASNFRRAAMTKSPKKQRLSVYLEPDVMKALAAHAARRGHSLSLIAEAGIASFL